MTKTRTVAILALPGVQLLDVSGPLDVFAEANVQARREVYRLLLVASKGGELAAIAFADSSFLPIPPDLLLVPMALVRPKQLARVSPEEWQTRCDLAACYRLVDRGPGAGHPVRPATTGTACRSVANETIG
jgi:transcriptional regulator GlxA family with amidase domain